MKDLLWGGTRPGPKFWLLQFLVLAAFNLLPPALYVLFAFAMVGRSNPTLFAVAFVIAFLIPAIGWLQHFVAVWRAGNRAVTGSGKFLCRAYAPTLLALTFLIIPAFIRLKATRFRTQARQTEAKVVLAAAYSGEKAFWAEHGRYGESFKEIGFARDGKPIYAAALARCREGKLDRTDIQLSEGLQSGAEERRELEAKLRELAQQESCEGRKEGFTVWAAGRIGYDGAGLDIWRINEGKKLENIQSGL